MSTRSSTPSACPAPSGPPRVLPVSTSGNSNLARIGAALRHRWDTAKPVIYDGTNFCMWKKSLESVFKLRRAGWLQNSSQARAELNELSHDRPGQLRVRDTQPRRKSARNLSVAYGYGLTHHSVDRAARSGSLRRALQMQSTDTVAEYFNALARLREEYQEVG
jgi:hypothetical protein